MKKIILFDFDGTIADSFDNFLTIIERIREKYALPEIPKEIIEELRNEDARTLIKKLKIPFFKIPFIARDMKKIQGESIEKIQPFKNLPEVLKKLKDKGYFLGILTSNGERNVRNFLKKHDLEKFEFIHCDSSLFGKDKSIEKFLSQNFIEKGNVLYVGDEIRDIFACRKVGIKIIAVGWGFNSKEGLLKNKPDY